MVKISNEMLTIFDEGDATLCGGNIRPVCVRIRLKAKAKLCIFEKFWMMQHSVGKSDLCVAGLGIDPHEALWAEEKQGLLDQLGHCCQ